VTKTTIEIFRAGTHTAMDGKTYTFTKADLEATAAAYDPAVFSAPCVVGHPKTDDPAYGWAQSMRVEGEVLVADVDQVEPAFAEMVNAGRYKKVSPWFYGPAAQANPVPGVYYPRHIGFLGAAAPGCQGLAPVAFAAGDDAELIAFATDEELRPLVWLARNVGRMFRRMRDQLIEDKGLEEANKLLPEWEVDAPAEIAAQLDVALSSDARPAFAAPEAPSLAAPTADLAADPADADRLAALAAREAALAEREAGVTAREAAFAETARADRVQEDAVFLDGLIAAGRLAPGCRAEVAVFCAALGDGETIAFAEGGEAEDPRARFKAFLDKHLGVSIHLGEIAGGEGLRFAEGQSQADIEAAIDAEMASAAAAGHPISAAEANRRAKSRR